MYDILKRALDDALTRKYADELSAAEEVRHTFTPEFESRMNALIRRTDRPYMKYVKILSAAACAVIAAGCAVLLPRLLDRSVPVEQPAVSETSSVTEAPVISEPADTDDISAIDDADDDEIIEETAVDDGQENDGDEIHIPSAEVGIRPGGQDDIHDDDSLPPEAGTVSPVSSLPPDETGENDQNPGSGGALPDQDIPVPAGEEDDPDEGPLADAEARPEDSEDIDGDDAENVTVSDDDDAISDDSQSVVVTSPVDDTDDGNIITGGDDDVPDGGAVQDDDDYAFDRDDDDDDDSDDDDRDDFVSPDSSDDDDDDDDDDDVDWDDDWDDDSDDDDGADDDAVIVVRPAIPAEETFGQEIITLTGCPLSETYMVSGYCTVDGNFTSFPIIKDIPASRYHNAELEALLENARLVSAPSLPGSFMLRACISSVQPIYGEYSGGWEDSSRKRYDYWFRGTGQGIGDDDCDDDYDDDLDEWDYEDYAECVINFYSVGYIEVSRPGTKGAVFYYAGSAAAEKLAELLAPFAPCEPSSVNDLRVYYGTDSPASVRMRVFDYYDVNGFYPLSDGSFIDELLKKYGDKPMTVVTSGTTVMTIHSYSVSALRSFDIDIDALGTVSIRKQRKGFRISWADCEALLSEFCRQSGTAAPVFYRDLSEYLKDKNFKDISFNSFTDSGKNYSISDPAGLKELYSLVLSRAAECKLTPSNGVYMAGGQITLASSDWNAKMKISPDAVGLLGNRFDVPKGFYDELCGIFRRYGELKSTVFYDDDDDDEDSPVIVGDEEAAPGGRGGDDEHDGAAVEDESGLSGMSFAVMSEALEYAGVSGESVTSALYAEPVSSDGQTVKFAVYRAADDVLAGIREVLSVAAGSAAASDAAVTAESAALETPAGRIVIYSSDKAFFAGLYFELPPGTFERLAELIRGEGLPILSVNTEEGGELWELW